ncbi:YpmS family protein [Bacillus rubiinfantis]|uniref:YpmS family protein n=1 Tax=Bacillus rubiinfantis TaxID=1499680 RepID=UPI0005A80BAF|nr:YpmS family protein [Bacillus rubiinfantis]
MKNKWKIGFLALLAMNLLVAIIILSLIFHSSNDTEQKIAKQPMSDHISFHVKSNKADLNKLINHYIEEEAADSPIRYRVLLANEVELYGKIPVFSEELDLKLTFEPQALKNGNLVLKQQSMSLGDLPLPISYVLKFIRDNYKLPKGVIIRPNDKLVYINMQQLKLKSDLKIKADTFDLKHDKVAFTIMVPVK